MDGVLEFHGRLARADKRPANPGTYCLQFQLHNQAKIGGKRDRVFWEETLESVAVSPGGFYRVVLGRMSPVPGDVFKKGPRWMSVQVVRSGRLDGEFGTRIPVLGQPLRLVRAIEKTDARINDLESQVKNVSSSAPRVEQFHTRLKRMTEALEALHTRLGTLEEGVELHAVIRRLEALTGRLDDIDKNDGRLDRVECELDDLVGPDGDVIDLNERMDRVEGKAPELIATLRQRERDAPKALEFEDISNTLDQLQVQINMLQAAQEVIETKPTQVEVDVDSIGALKRSGDVMTGGLTINRGGLEVLSGGVSCRGATVTTLESTKLVKTPKLIAEQVELRGDFTVDSADRLMQVRHIEGRQASARRDGALHLNGRGGGEVVLGNKKAARGAQVHGSVRADGLVAQANAGVAQLFHATGQLKAGDVVRVNDTGERVVRVRKAQDPRVIGVVTDAPGLLLGGETRTGVIPVAITGVVQCRVDARPGAISAGDLLVAGGEAGHAVRSESPAPGTVLGKALAGRAKGKGLIPVLLGGG